MYKNFIILMLIFLAIKSSAFEVIGYCGAAGHAPENTLLSFETAINMGITAIELDVLVCKSGQVVVTHDNDLQRTANSAKLVSKMNLDALKALDFGEGQQIPTLIEALDFINRRVKVIIDLKSGSAFATARIVKDYLENRGWSGDDLIICSDLPEELINFKKKVPSVRVAAVFCSLGFEEGLKKFAGISFDFITLRMYKINKEIVEAVHKMGKKLNVSCKDTRSEEYGDVEDFTEMRMIGVDGIQSAYPDKVIKSGQHITT